MDDRTFLARGAVEERVLPYLGGGRVETRDRRYRLAAPPAPGWYRFALAGQEATVLGPGAPEGLERLPPVRGHWVDGWLVREGGRLEWLHLPPAAAPARFAPMRARRWHSGEVLHGELEPGSDAEPRAREALEAGRPLPDAQGVPASLRAAFGLARLQQVAQRLGVPLSPLEVRLLAAEAAAEEDAALEARLERLEAQRRAWSAADAARTRARLERIAALPDVPTGRMQAARMEPGERAREALEAAGARLLEARALGGGRLDVVFRFLGERFVAQVDARTLQVVDPGVCLADGEAVVTLESLPAVLRAAVERGQLVVTRRG